jgi:hypothetical protein
VTTEKSREAFLARAACIAGTRIAFQEGQSYRRADLREDHGGSRPESLQLGAKTVGQRDPGFDQILAGAGEDFLSALLSSESGTRARKR